VRDIRYLVKMDPDGLRSGHSSHHTLRTATYMTEGVVSIEIDWRVRPGMGGDDLSREEGGETMNWKKRRNKARVRFEVPPLQCHSAQIPMQDFDLREEWSARWDGEYRFEGQHDGGHVPSRHKPVQSSRY
jgi:hypothetical protein